MKKNFVINAPRHGRSTVTMVTHVYAETTKRTRTVYLGSFAAGLDPETIPSDGSIPPGHRRYGVSLTTSASASFGQDELAIIRNWLEVHGSFRREQRLHQAQQRAEQERRRQEVELLRSQIESELRPKIQQEVTESLERARIAAEPGPMEAAMAALQHAADYVEASAAQLRSQGIEVTNIRRAGLRNPRAANQLDTLQTQANRIRVEALGLFEGACKRSRIMADRARKRATT